MATSNKKPVTPGTRFREIEDFSELTKVDLPKSLLQVKNRINGRNSQGRITMRRRGGGHKKKYRIVDFKRLKSGIPALVTSLVYDPNRSARLAYLQYPDGVKSLVIAPSGVKVGDKITSYVGVKKTGAEGTGQKGGQFEIKPGNALALKDIPVGEFVHNVELKPGGGAIIARSAGVGAQLMAKADKYAQLRLPSGEQRKVLLTCSATIGSVGNGEHSNYSIGKAGAMRWRGRRPKVRGVAMNPVDHPHGGGEGKTSGGRHPVSPWGTPTKGFKTRHNKRTDSFIVRRRTK